MLVGACGDTPTPPAPAPAPAPAPQAARPVPQAAAASPETEEPAAEETSEFAYDISLRDPFQPAAGAAGAQEATHCGPLCQYDVGQYRIIGIVWGIAQPVAMLRSPDGKPHIAKVGTPIGKNNGKIVSISKDRLVVLEKYVNYRGEVVTNRVDVELPTEEGARR